MRDLVEVALRESCPACGAALTECVDETPEDYAAWDYKCGASVIRVEGKYVANDECFQALTEGLKKAALAAEADRGVGEPVAWRWKRVGSGSWDWHFCEEEPTKLGFLIIKDSLYATPHPESQNDMDSEPVARMREALESIRQYGADTSSGRVGGQDDRKWQRDAVREMTRRAHQALARAPRDEASAPVSDAVRERADQIIKDEIAYSQRDDPNNATLYAMRVLRIKTAEQIVGRVPMSPSAPASVQGNSSDGGSTDAQLIDSTTAKTYVHVPPGAEWIKGPFNPGNGNAGTTFASDPAPQGQDADEQLAKSLFEHDHARPWSDAKSHQRDHYLDQAQYILGLSQFRARTRTRAPEAVVFWYKNYEDKEGYRRAVPISMRFGTSEWHKKPQWLLLAFDEDKKANREFAVADMRDVIGQQILHFAAPPAKPVSVETIEACANRMWRVHPKELQDRGITRQQFYVEQINALIYGGDKSDLAREEGGK